MFIDYVTLLVTNTAAGFFLLAWYLTTDVEGEGGQKWASPFALVGLVGVVNGGLMVHGWPLPGPFNMAFGEMSLMFGMLMLAAALSLAKGWDLTPVALYGLFAGLASVLIGARIIGLGLTREPMVAGGGFILSGIGGVFAAPLLRFRTHRAIRLAAAAVLMVTALLWARTGYKAYWGHMSDFSAWAPATMQPASKQ